MKRYAELTGIRTVRSGDKKLHDNKLETQIELLKKYGMDNPYSGMAEKVQGYQFSEKVTVRDPYSGKKDLKPIKPFMVNNSVNIFEKSKIVFNNDDKDLYEHFTAYTIKSISSSGLPIYDGGGMDHSVDAVNLALLAFTLNYDDIVRRVVSSRVSVFDKKFEGKEKEEVKTRKIPVAERRGSAKGFSINKKSRAGSPFRSSRNSAFSGGYNYSRGF